LNQKVLESIIDHTIKSSSKKYDFTSEGMQALKQAHASPGVLAAMCDESARVCAEAQKNAATPGSKVELNPQPFPPQVANSPGTGGTKVELNPQPFPPKANGASPAHTALKQLKLAAPKALRRLSNARFSQQDAGIIAVL